ncbi:MAG: protein phosphatase 2C domain-containing protein [Candidatus Caldarchaeum sp.]
MNPFKKLFAMSSQGEMSISYGVTDRGIKRRNNEDSFLLLPERGIYVVADGMGGHNAGEVASRKAVDFISSYFSPELVSKMRRDPLVAKSHLTDSFLKLHEVITALSGRKKVYTGMGTTLAGAFLHKDLLHTCHVGDSRVYVAGEHGIRQVTNDHSEVWKLVKGGVLSVDEARRSPLRNKINQAIGAPFPIKPEYNCLPLGKGDIVLLCSDGLWDMLCDSEIYEIVVGSNTLEQAAKGLVRAANERGGDDNITVVLVRACGEEGAAEVG